MDVKITNRTFVHTGMLVCLCVYAHVCMHMHVCVVYMCV